MSGFPEFCLASNHVLGPHENSNDLRSGLYIGLATSGKLYIVNHRAPPCVLESNVTSFAVTPHFIIFTTTSHETVFASLAELSISLLLGSDPLNLLLHNNAHNHDSPLDVISSSQPGISSDWSHLTALWPSTDRFLGENLKFPELEFNHMDLDYNPTMAVDPSALHLASTHPQHSFFRPNGVLSYDLLATSFPFTFSSDESGGSSHEYTKPRRLSMTSPSSSSGASLSPVMESMTTVASSQLKELADELANRVRKSVGVTLAVPLGIQKQIIISLVHFFSSFL